MSKSASSFRIGTGAGFAADRLDPAVDLAERGELDVMVLECLGERTVAFGHRDRMADPNRGYNAHLHRRMHALLPACRAAGTTIVTNMGAANPRAAAQRTVEIARELGLKGLKVACIEGDDVSDVVERDHAFMDEPGTLSDIGMPVVGMNAYLGADAIIPALRSRRRCHHWRKTCRPLDVPGTAGASFRLGRRWTRNAWAQAPWSAI